ncbi:MAG: NB-ARC domain-containing protein [Anaerolineae bacterium]
MADQAARDGVFISYATGDGTAFAEGLRAALTAHHIDVWQDVIKLRGGDNWWQQIVEAITSVKYVLMVLTPLALGRPTVQKEWRLARQEGVRVLPILASPEVTIDSLPRWMQKIQLYRLGFDPSQIDQAKNWPLFLNDLQTTYELKRRPFMADDLGVFVPRQREYDALIDLLIHTGRGDPKAITSALALKGAGGYGKTTLARAICHDERIQEAFDDGILWVTIGESATADTVRQQIDSLITVLSGERYDAPSLEAAKTRLRELLADRDMLMVIDDVWNADHLRPFLQGGERVARLITTRMGDVLPDGAQQVGVNQMTGEEAFALLTHALPAADVQAERSALMRLAADLMEYPLPIKLANGILRERVNDKRQPLNKALTYVNDLLAEFGLALDDRTSIVEAALRASLDQLDAIDLMHFKRLAIFPEDVAIPLRSLSHLWRISAVRAERVCERLFDLSLLLDFDLTAQTIRLHDVIRDLLIRQAGSLLPRHGKLDALSMIPLTNIDLGTDQYLAMSGDLPAWHREFLGISAVQARITLESWADLPDDEPYLWEWLSYHLIEAGWGESLIRTVLDLRYLARKTEVKSPTLVERDLETAAQFARVNSHDQTAALELLARNYRNMAHILRRCETPKDMLFTLHLRLNHLDLLKPSCDAVAPSLKPSFLIPWRELPDLPHPALLRTLTFLPLTRLPLTIPDSRLITSASFWKQDDQGKDANGCRTD